MMIRHLIGRGTVACALALVAGVAVAAKPYQVTDTGTVAKAGSFTQAFSFMTGANYDVSKGIIYVTGLDSLFSDVKLDIRSSSGQDLTGYIPASHAGTSWSSSFSDNLSSVSLSPSTTYRVLVSGTAKVDGAQFGLTGAFLKDGTHFTAMPVPEPETYAMLLAGLGMMGGIARRRMRKD